MRRGTIALIGFVPALACGCEGVIGGPETGAPSAELASNQDPGASNINETTNADAGVTATIDAAADPVAMAAKLAGDVTIAEIAVYQALKATIAKDGKAATPGVPLVAGRNAFVRAYVRRSSTYTARELTAVLRLVDRNGKAIKAFSDAKTLRADSSDDMLASTFNFELPGDDLPEGVKIAVAVTDANASQPADNTESDARFPKDGTETTLGVVSTGPSIRVVIVPIAYTADGSGRLPDTSAAQIDRYKNALLRMYPTPNVEVTVRSQPFTYNGAINRNGDGWSELLDTMHQLRESDGVDDDVYYWGAFSSATSQNAYCNGSCVLGLSAVVSDPANAFLRASIGVGFSGALTAETMAHELGHAHGRSHAPCVEAGSIDGVDPQFPHPEAQIGLPGYDFIDKTLIATDAHDFMGYCKNTWVSDYTYKALFTRVQTINKGKPLHLPTDDLGGGGSSQFQARALRPEVTYQIVSVGADGPSRFGRRTTARTIVGGQDQEVELLDAQGNVIGRVVGHYHAWDHLAGGTLMIPDSGQAYSGIKVGNRTVMR